MRLPAPTPPPYAIRDWQRRPFAERLQMVCAAWARDGYGTPWSVYVFYLLKIALYLAGWSFFASFTPGLGGLSRLVAGDPWWTAPEAFEKAILWSLLYETLGLGCGSGPLTGRYLPPIAAPLYFLRPGTTKLPLFPSLPLLGGHRRGPLDVLLYAAWLAALVRALVAPALTPSLLLPPIALLPLLGLADKTLWLAARAEHYYTALVCLLFVTGGAGDPPEWVPACKLLWVAVWFGAATSKLNHHFPSVVAVMQSNSPLTWPGGLRRLFFRRYPDDLRPSRLVTWMAHAGTATEYAFPLLLLAGRGGSLTETGLVVMVLFHAFITSSIPMGVPLEWNFLMVYGGLFLFGHHAALPATALHSPLLIAWLVANCVILPVVGNVLPARVSFLMSMRYYAGNWPFGVWLFRGQAWRKLDTHLVKSAPCVRGQLAPFYDEDTVTAVLSKVMAFRAMHLHGRALRDLVERATADQGGPDAPGGWDYWDGELVAGVVLGWNFGDGHLHHEQLLEAVQRQCGFEPGELRCVFVESQPVGRPDMEYRIVDAAEGERERGHIEVAGLLEKQPWHGGCVPRGTVAA